MRGILGGSAAHMQGPPTLIARSSRLCRRISATPTGRHVAQRRAVLATAAARSPSLSSIDLDGNNPLGEKYMLSNGMIDYYALLGVDDDATPDEVKRAYRSLAKQCHPDFLGDEGHDICILLNEAYQVLSEPVTRDAYNARLEAALKDDEDDFTGQLLSKWMPATNPAMAKNTDPNESRGVFVDEFTCIGCKQCVWHAPATFRIEPDHGRSRVYAQWLDNEDKLQAAIDSCPVSCIHWVEREQLVPLEYVMQKRLTQRTNVGVMMAGQGATADVWAATEQFLKERRRRVEAQKLAAQRKAYSPAQEESRRAATNALRRKTMGGVFAKFSEVMDNIALAMTQTVGAPEDYAKVGKRKRMVRWDEAMRATLESQDYYLVPPERALVPVSCAARDADD
uniref:J domain-containing protein n=1 Tax=Chlamydomonas leiostraca TaxID=1034604 RepID=A0A7S0S1M0_9CHLO|mmetsp:Transcript_3879/g.9690  ORF Transcript_3879/g.9690 Transcript_3879/m.9690 type:complete len:395 (+) Transcript_3879:44-1228(+)